MSLKKKKGGGGGEEGSSTSVSPAMTYRWHTWSLTKAFVKKLETSQRAMERRMLNVKLKTELVTQSSGKNQSDRQSNT